MSKREQRRKTTVPLSDRVLRSAGAVSEWYNTPFATGELLQKPEQTAIDVRRSTVKMATNGTTIKAEDDDISPQDSVSNIGEQVSELTVVVN